MKYSKPKVFKPTEKDAMIKVAEFLSPDKEISSTNYPSSKQEVKGENLIKRRI